RDTLEYRRGLPGRLAQLDWRSRGRTCGRVRYRVLQTGVRPLGDVLPADRRRPRRPRPRRRLVAPRRGARRGARAPVRVDQPARRVEPDPESCGAPLHVGAALYARVARATGLMAVA